MSDATLNAEVIQFRSAIDGSEQSAGICAPATIPDGAKLPLLVELEPGSIDDLEGTLADGRRYLEMVGEPAVWVRPGGRGPGTVFQGYGEVDVFEAIEAAAAKYPIDRDRISLFGFSMGGAGVWYLGSHYPDRFAAIAPLGAYNDYRLWTRPDGMTFPTMPWEEPSWQARSGALLLENLRHVGVWMVHGAWDRAVGGGVDVEQSRRSSAALEELGFEHRLTELPEVGHDSTFMAEPLFAEVLRFLVSRRRPAAPERVTFRTQGLRHSRAYWVEIQQQERYGEQSRVDARAGETVVVETTNVRHLTLRPSAGTAVEIDGTRIGGLDLSAGVGLRGGDDGVWVVAGLEPPEGEKRPQLAGPFGDLFRAGTALVTGTGGSKEETFFEDWSARDAQFFFKQWNGGVHRGGIPGESYVVLPVATDAAWDGSAPNVVAYGTVASNGLLAAAAAQIAIGVEPGVVRVGDRRFEGEGIAVIAVMPNADGSGYLALHGGTSPDATTAGAHLNWQLLPDYLVYDQTRVLEWGFFDNEWQPIRAGGSA